MLVAEGTLGGQISSSSLDSGKPYGFWCVAFMGFLLLTLQGSFDFCQFSPLVCQLSTAFLSPHLFAMILLLFKNTQFFPCCSNQEPWMKHVYFIASFSLTKACLVINIDLYTIQGLFMITSPVVHHEGIKS